MHQTFYVDIDEEISSVIDRLNKSMASLNYFVVPRRALFFQSIVNLKILKRESEKAGKRVIIVTQDEIGSSMAQRSGIEFRQNLEEKEIKSQQHLASNKIDEYLEEEDFESLEIPTIKNDKQIRLSNLGSGDFFQEDNEIENKVITVKKTGKNILKENKQVHSVGRPRILPSKIVLEKPGKNLQAQQSHLPDSDPIKKSFPKQLDPHKAETLEKIFKDQNKKPKTTIPHKQIKSSNFKKFFLGFMLFLVLIIIGAAAFLYIPSAKITLISNISVQKNNTDIVARANISSVEQGNIPLYVINKDDQYSLNYDVKGQAVVSGKKAHGSVKIFNEFSPQPQTLIATTRLQSEDGKIFRINKNVVVPGYTTEAGQVKAGTVEAEVTADQAGSDYNIANSKFTIPGFSGSPKFQKFYASSDSEMLGGSSDGEVATGGGSVTQTDLDGAKLKAEANFKEKMNQYVKDHLSPDQIVLPQAIKITITRSVSTAKIGSVADSFEWLVSGNIQALVFSEKDVKNLLTDMSDKDENFKKDISKIDYGSGDPNFEASVLKFKVYSETTSTPVLDEEKIKLELLGKSDDQLSDILRKHSTIKSANVEFSPTFITHIPQYSSRVFIELKK